jgi:hypothetical protein
LRRNALPEALVQLRALTSPTVYSGTLERIFKIPRRTAIRLTHGFGGERAGRTFPLDRRKLTCAVALVNDQAEVF